MIAIGVAIVRALLFAGLLVLLGGCASNGVPVYDIYDIYHRNQPPDEPVTSGSYTVQRGDTLYAIAFRHGWKPGELARVNGLKSPYTIYPGQTIHFKQRVPVATASPTTSTAPASSPKASKPPSKPTTAPASPTHSAASLPSGQPGFRWPSAGNILSHFGDADSKKGMNFGGSKGAPVLASAKGEVVYRGSDIKGYGNLLIIKHNEQWLTAYAHNQTLLVSEGDMVSAGQKIATLGDSGSWRTQLYFEIRKAGNPVDPERLLPKR